MSKKPGPKPLNTRQQKYKNNLIAGMTKYNAAIAAGYSESTAISHTKDLDKRVGMRNAMERLGLTDKYLAQKLLELLTATKVVGYLHQYANGEKGGIEKAEPGEAVSNDFIEVPDWTARAKGLDLACKLNHSLENKGDQLIANYTQMTMIQLNDNKPMALDIGEIPDHIKQRMGNGKIT